MGRLKAWAQQLKAELVALWFCTRHPRTPLHAKALAMALVAYAFSPIDLIPDFIPVLGYLDELILLPIGTWVVLKLVPGDVMLECREQAARWLDQRPKPPALVVALVCAVIFAIWLTVLWLAWRWAYPHPSLPLDKGEG